jgi:hypothetical protein
MKDKPQFTSEELLYIEKNFDLMASILDNKVHQICEDFILSQTTNNDELKKLCANRIIENGKSSLIIKSIRDKIESWRDEDERTTKVQE